MNNLGMIRTRLDNRESKHSAHSRAAMAARRRFWFRSRDLSALLAGVDRGLAGASLMLVSCGRVPPWDGSGCAAFAGRDGRAGALAAVQ